MEEYKHFAELQFDSDEEEIHLLKIPKDIDPNVLLHAKLDLTKKSKVKAQSEIFHLEPISDKCEPTYFLGPNGLKKVEPSSVLLLTKSVSKKNIKGGLNHFLQLEGENKKEAVVPIDSIKKRHPLFGDKYKAKVELQDEIKQKLMEAIHSFDKNEKNSKRKKKQVVDNEEYDDKSLLISQILQTKFKSKKSTNVENTEDLDSCPTTSSNFQCEINNLMHKKKSKKRNSKHKGENSFQEHDFSDLKGSASVESPIPLQKEHENIHEGIKKELQSDAQNFEGIPNNKKKKKKHNKSVENTEELSGNLQFEIDNVVHKDKKKKKRNSKHGEENSFQEKNIESGSMIHDVSHLKDFASVESLIPSTRKVQENIYADIKKELQSDAENLENIPNKKKKKNGRRENGIISVNMKEETVSYVESSSKGKKKKQERVSEQSATIQPENTGAYSNISVDIKKEIQSDAENLASSLKEKTKKKKKHKNEYSSLTESSIYLENMSKDVKKELQSDHENLESTPNERKKKKRRRDSEASFPSLDFNNSFMPPAKKRRPSLLSSTVIKDSSPEFKPNLSVILGN